MKNKIIIFVVLLVLFASFGVSASQEWSISSEKDEMSEEISWYANSPTVTATEEMGFPYKGTKAWIGVGYDGDNTWAYFGFTNQPNITNDDTKDGYNVIPVRIKFDDDIKKTFLRQDWGSKFLHIRNKNLIEDIKKHKTLLLELKWHGEDEVYFEFPLNGSADAINKIHNKFD